MNIYFKQPKLNINGKKIDEMCGNLKILVLSTLNRQRNKKNFVYFSSQLKTMIWKRGQVRKIKTFQR